MNASIAAVLVSLWIHYRPARAKRLYERLVRIEPRPRIAYACAGALVALFAAQAGLLLFQVRYESTPAWAWAQRLPLPVYDGRWGRIAYHRIDSYAALVIAVLETPLLAYLALAVARRLPHAGRAAAAAAGLLAAISLATPAMGTTDPYEYAASSMIGWASYAPPRGIFDKTAYASIFAHVPLRGVLYGPLWLAFDTVEIGWIPSIVGKIVALRVVNAGLLVLFAVLLARLQRSRVALVACIANPSLWYYCVLSPHAEIEGLVAIAGAALAIAASRPRSAMVLVGVAGCFKLPFVVAGVTVFALLESTKQRIGYALGAVTLALAGTVILAGPLYLRGFGTYLAHSHDVSKESANGYWVLFGAFAVAATALLVVYRRAVPAAAWTFAHLAPLGAAWYVLWGLPFAARAGILTAFVLLLPLATTATDHAFDLTPLPQFALLGALGVVAADEIRARRRKRGYIL